LKKVMLLAAMLAMVLAAAVPALAQSVTQVGEGNVACVQTAVQSQGNAQANQYGDNINVQNISQECNISVAEAETAVKYLPVKEYAPVKKYEHVKKYASAPAKYQYEYKKYYKSAPAVQYKKYYESAPAVQYKYSASPSASAYSASAYSASASAYSAPAAELPPTGGSSLIALGAGVLLVAGGLLARRIVR
jgi:hypothetical protein